jgi:penicillin-binding protein 1B
MDSFERLLRVGYREGEDASEFSSGSFSVHPGFIELRSNELDSSTRRPSLVRIRFNRDRVTAIEQANTSAPLKELRLPGELLTADINTKKQTRRAISFADLPPVLITALIAVEDRRFFEHHGVDLHGVVRALYTNLVSGRIRQGGSTLTQQLIKGQFLTKDRTYSRKLAEMMMAIAIERKLTKEQILTLYCDRVYLGHSGSISIYGFKQAASILFGKELKDISLSEAACLAGLAQAPNRYSVHSRPEDAIARRNVVLDAMVETRKISADEAEISRREELVLLPPQRLDDTAAPHFVDYVSRELASHQFEDEKWPHLRIETTIDLDLQEAANNAVTRHLDRLKKTLDKKKNGS